MIINKFTEFINKVIRSNIDKDTKQTILKVLKYGFEHTEIEGTRDGFKVKFKTKI